MRIAVIGSGYVGLVTGTCLAEIGHVVVCADNDESKIQTLEAGELPIYEPQLSPLVATNRQAGRLAFTSSPEAAVRSGDAIFICVGTPPLESGDADLSSIDRVARIIATEARSPKLVVEKSTVPVRTGQELKRALAVYGRDSGVRFRVASNPEFLREGSAVEDFFHPNRIVFGVDDPETEADLRAIYQPIIEQRFQCPIHQPACLHAHELRVVVTTINSAELIKHASNSFLALKVSYANAIADLCERLGADVEEVTEAMGLDPRIGAGFLRSGLGFGGFCLPKDLQAFIRLAERVGFDFTLLKEADKINRGRVPLFLEKIRRALWVVKDKQIAMLGLAFKPNTDDIRFAPAIDLIAQLRAQGARVRAYDPAAGARVRSVYSDVECVDDPYAAAAEADALLLVTEWEMFRRLDWARVRESMSRPLVLDGRNLLDPQSMHSLGFEYYSIGRGDGPR